MRTLADRLARGEDSAFAELYDLCAEGLFRYAAARLGSPDDASDLVQTAFLRAVNSRRRFRGVESPAAYLFQIARNELARAARKRSRTERPLEGAELLPAKEASDDPETARAALARLHPADRELVELKLYAGLTFQEIAAATSQPLGTVTTKYRRSLESLRRWLAKELSTD